MSGPVAVALVLVLSTVPASAVEEVGPSWRGLEIVDLEGRGWTAEELTGRVVLLDFWATWCAPCLAELPTLERAWSRWRHDDLLILGVALDTGSRADLLRFLRRHRVAWPQSFDGRGLEGSLPRRFGVETVPRTLLFDRRGRLVAIDLRGEALLLAIEGLLGRSAPPDRLSAPGRAP